jgi:2-keto-3-deoxy-galactonokinase
LNAYNHGHILSCGGVRRRSGLGIAPYIPIPARKKIMAAARKETRTR